MFILSLSLYRFEGESSRFKLTFPESDTLLALAGLIRVYLYEKEAYVPYGRDIARHWEADLLPLLVWIYKEQHKDSETLRVQRDERPLLGRGLPAALDRLPIPEGSVRYTIPVMLWQALTASGRSTPHKYTSKEMP